MWRCITVRFSFFCRAWYIKRVHDITILLASPNFIRDPSTFAELRKLTLRSAPSELYNLFLNMTPSLELLQTLKFVLAPPSYLNYTEIGHLDQVAFEAVPLSKFPNLEQVVFECPPGAQEPLLAINCVEALRRKYPEFAQKEGFIKLIFL